MLCTRWHILQKLSYLFKLMLGLILQNLPLLVRDGKGKNDSYNLCNYCRKNFLFYFPIVFTSRLLFKSGRKGKSGFSFCQVFLRKKIIYLAQFLNSVLFTAENQRLV